MHRCAADLRRGDNEQHVVPGAVPAGGREAAPRLGVLLRGGRHPGCESAAHMMRLFLCNLESVVDRRRRRPAR